MSQYAPKEYKTNEQYPIPKDGQWVVEIGGIFINIIQFGKNETDILADINGKRYLINSEDISKIRFVIPLELIEEMRENICYIKAAYYTGFPMKCSESNNIKLLIPDYPSISFVTEVIS